MATVLVEAPVLRDPAGVPEVFATGVAVEIVGGIAHIVFFQDRSETERIVVARLVMEAFRLENCHHAHSCVRGDCSNRVKPMTS